MHNGEELGREDLEDEISLLIYLILPQVTTYSLIVRAADHYVHLLYEVSYEF